MFDIAWSELFVIMVVALVVVGPKDLPKLMRTAGQWASRARAMADQFRRSFDEMARHAELDELRNQVNQLKNTPMTDLDYESFGIKDLPAKPFDISGRVEDVGAAPPKAVPAPETPGSSPAVPKEAPKLESSPPRAAE